MSRRPSLPMLALIVVASVTANGCQQLFTTSLASFLARPPQAPVIEDAAELQSLLPTILADSASASAALDGVLALANAPGATAETKKAAVEVALAASGIGDALTDAATIASSALSGGTVDQAAISAVLSTVNTSGSVAEALALASDPSVASDGNTLLQAGAVLALSEAAQTVNIATATPEEIAAAIPADSQSISLLQLGSAAIQAEGGSGDLAALLAGFVGAGN